MRKLYFAMRLIAWFVIELCLANLVVARVVLRPRLRITPGIIALNTRLESDLAITWLANLITLTPGTLTLDVSRDKRTLFIHTLNVEAPDEVTAGIRRAFEDNLLELEK